MDSSATSDFQQLIATQTLPDLGPGPRPGVRPLAQLRDQVQSFVAGQRLPFEEQEALKSAAFLWHDYLDESHTISQSLSGRTGSFLHAIMHRREPDYSNAKYWFRQVGEHPAFPEIAEQITSLLQEPNQQALRGTLLSKGHWIPDAFVDACRSCASLEGDVKTTQLLQQIQAIEFNVLLQHL